MSDLIGATIGNYEITGVIGAGGMATVYSARQKNIRRDVAVKVVKSGVGDAAIMLQRFEREVNTVGALTHPNILKVFDYGEVQGVIYLVMEWQKGGSLAALIKAQTRLDFPHDQPSVQPDCRCARLCPRTGYCSPRFEAPKHPHR